MTVMNIQSSLSGLRSIDFFVNSQNEDWNIQLEIMALLEIYFCCLIGGHPAQLSTVPLFWGEGDGMGVGE